MLCLVPGLVLLWARPGTSTRVKGAVSVVVVGLLVLAGVSDPADPVEDPAAVSAASGSGASPSASDSATPHADAHRDPE